MNRHSARRDGCGFLLLTAVITGIFLIINAGVFGVLYSIWTLNGPSLFQNPKVTQFCIFVGPVAMVIAEWWLVDLVVESLMAGADRWRRRE